MDADHREMDLQLPHDYSAWPSTEPLSRRVDPASHRPPEREGAKDRQDDAWTEGIANLVGEFTKRGGQSEHGAGRLEDRPSQSPDNKPGSTRNSQQSCEARSHTTSTTHRQRNYSHHDKTGQT